MKRRSFLQLTGITALGALLAGKKADAEIEQPKEPPKKPESRIVHMSTPSGTHNAFYDNYTQDSMLTVEKWMEYNNQRANKQLWEFLEGKEK